MTDYYVYVDETGSADYNKKSGEYFSVGSVAYEGDHRDPLWRGFQLRADLEARGVHLPTGFHAADDSRATRNEVFEAIKQFPPMRFDATHLLKENAYDSVRKEGKTRLYHLALYIHLKHVLQLLGGVGDRVFVIAGTIHLTKGTAQAAKGALEDVCRQSSKLNRPVIPCLWEARTSWGIQVADYCLWALQREIAGKPCQWFPSVVKPLQASDFYPWGRK